MLIQVVAASGQIVYVFIWNSLGQVWNTNTNLFETYNVSNWSKYAVTATEQAGSGSYFATVPTQITTPGNYTWAGYIRLGGSPASGDTPVNQGNFTISATSSNLPVPSTLAALILSLRALVQDLPDSKTVWQEQLGSNDQPSFPVDGVNRVFRLKKAPLSDVAGAASYVWISIIGTGAVQRTQVGFTVVDQVSGIIQFTSAPNPGNGTYPLTPPSGVYADYGYLWFSDAKYAEFLSRAANNTVAATSNPASIPEGLLEAMLQFAVAQFWYARSSQYAEQYASSGGDAREDVQTVSQAYKALGDSAFKNARTMRDDYYKRQSQREAPAFGDINHNWDPITPIR